MQYHRQNTNQQRLLGIPCRNTFTEKCETNERIYEKTPICFNWGYQREN